MLVKKICAYVFLIFYNCFCIKFNISGDKFSSFFTRQIKFYRYLILIAKKLKKLKTDNVRKQLKKSQIILKVKWCIENANINIQ